RRRARDHDPAPARHSRHHDSSGFRRPLPAHQGASPMTDTALGLPHAGPGNRTVVMAGRLALACALLVAWKIGADVAGALYVADPLKVAARIFADTQSGELIRHVIVTLR